MSMRGLWIVESAVAALLMPRSASKIFLMMESQTRRRNKGSERVFAPGLRKSVTGRSEVRVGRGRKLAGNLLFSEGEEVRLRTFTYVSFLMFSSATALAQVTVEVNAPPPPRVVVRAPAPPPPPRVIAPPPPRVVVSAPAPRVYVPPPPVVRVEPPTIRFAAPPPLVEVQPGVEVVEDADEEIFFTGGWYWHCSPEGTWFRTRNYRGGWAVAPPRVVPVAVARMPRGEYRHFHSDGRAELRHEQREIRREERQQHHEEHQIRREERHEQHEIQKAERRRANRRG
jgi:hypothetical protein